MPRKANPNAKTRKGRTDEQKAAAREKAFLRLEAADPNYTRPVPKVARVAAAGGGRRKAETREAKDSRNRKKRLKRETAKIKKDLEEAKEAALEGPRHKWNTPGAMDAAPAVTEAPESSSDEDTDDDVVWETEMTPLEAATLAPEWEPTIVTTNGGASARPPPEPVVTEASIAASTGGALGAHLRGIAPLTLAEKLARLPGGAYNSHMLVEDQEPVVLSSLEQRRLNEAAYTEKQALAVSKKLAAADYKKRIKEADQKVKEAAAAKAAGPGYNTRPAAPPNAVLGMYNDEGVISFTADEARSYVADHQHIPLPPLHLGPGPPPAADMAGRQGKVNRDLTKWEIDIENALIASGMDDDDIDQYLATPEEIEGFYMPGQELTGETIGGRQRYLEEEEEIEMEPQFADLRGRVSKRTDRRVEREEEIDAPRHTTGLTQQEAFYTPTQVVGGALAYSDGGMGGRRGRLTRGGRMSMSHLEADAELAAQVAQDEQDERREAAIARQEAMVASGTQRSVTLGGLGELREGGDGMRVRDYGGFAIREGVEYDDDYFSDESDIEESAY